MNKGYHYRICCSSSRLLVTYVHYPISVNSPQFPATNEKMTDFRPKSP